MDNPSEGNNTDDPCPILSVYKDVHYIYVYGIGPVTILGLIFNVITLIIFQRQRNKVNSIFLLKLLAVSDMMFLTVCLIYFPVRHLYGLATQGDMIFRRWDLDIGPWIFSATIPLYFTAQQNRNWWTVIITCERFLNLVFPFWARRVLTKRRLGYAFVVNFLVAVACNFYYFWVFPVLPHVNPCTGEDEMTVIFQSWSLQLDLWLFTVMTVFVPLFLLYFMNITLIIVLNRMFHRRGEMTGGKKDDRAQRQATMMVLGICICFLVCETPASLDRMATIAGVTFSEDDPFYNYGRKIGLMLVVVDSAANFISYICSNPQYRRSLVRLICCRSDEDGSTSTSVSDRRSESTAVSK